MNVNRTISHKIVVGSDGVRAILVGQLSTICATYGIAPPGNAEAMKLTLDPATQALTVEWTETQVLTPLPPPPPPPPPAPEAPPEAYEPPSWGEPPDVLPEASQGPLAAGRDTFFSMPEPYQGTSD